MCHTGCGGDRGVALLHERRDGGTQAPQLRSQSSRYSGSLHLKIKFRIVVSSCWQNAGSWSAHAAEGVGGGGLGEGGDGGEDGDGGGAGGWTPQWVGSPCGSAEPTRAARAARPV